MRKYITTLLSSSSVKDAGLSIPQPGFKSRWEHLYVSRKACAVLLNNAIISFCGIISDYMPYKDTKPRFNKLLSDVLSDKKLSQGSEKGS